MSLSVTGIPGGLVSSTAVTVSLAPRAKNSPATVPLAAIENIVMVTAASQDAAILRSAEGKARLRDVLTRKSNALLPKGGVRSVYFADVLIR